MYDDIYGIYDIYDIYDGTGVRPVPLYRRGHGVGDGFLPAGAPERPLPQEVDTDLLRLPERHPGNGTPSLYVHSLPTSTPVEIS